MMKHRKFIGRLVDLAYLVIAMTGCGSTSFAQSANSDAIQSGVYALRSVADGRLDSRKVYIAVDHDQVSGYFDYPFTQPASNVPDLDPSCRFLLRGKLGNGPRIILHAFYPDKQSGTVQSSGTLTLSKQDGAWAVTVDGDFPDCEVATVDNGDTVTLSEPRPNWRGFGYVVTSKAALYNSPSDAAKSSAYLIRYDPVALLREPAKRDWVYIDYFNARRGTLNRWMKSSDIR